MADVFITVFEGATSVANGDPIQYATAVIDGANSNAIAGTGGMRRHRYCRLYATAKCWVKWGAEPTATGADDAIALDADNPEYFDIYSGYVITAITRV